MVSKVFFDTSALIKLFHEEEGSEAVVKLVSDPDNEVWLLELAKIEFSSALHRRYRNREIGDQELEIALSGFREQLRLFNVLPLQTEVLDAACSLMEEHGKTDGLRALDALHLGAFSLLEEGARFVCSDKKLSKTAENAGYTVIDPTVSE